MYKLKQDKDKSPTFASCCVPAWTVCSDTPPEQPGQTAMASGPYRGREWLQDQAKGSDLHLWHLLG